LNFKLLISLVFLLVLASCANVRSPGGGDKDNAPPQPLDFSPPNESLHFNSQNFSITFDEWVQLDDIVNQLVVSPPLEKKPKVSIKKKTVFVNIDEALKPNTTYSFSFGEGIVDYTESNPADNLRYVFSTGDKLDSLEVQGVVKDAFTNSPTKGVKVMLYDGYEDSLIVKSKPYYFGVTNESGEFRIPYLRQGKFKVVALVDDNANYLADDGEKLGWFDDLVSPQVQGADSARLELKISLPEPSEQYLVDYSRDSTAFIRIKLNRPPRDFSFEILDYPNAVGSYHYDVAKDSVYFWLSNEPKNTSFRLVVSDTEPLDTLPLIHYQVNRKVTYPLSLAAGRSFEAKNGVVLSGRRVLESIDTALVKLSLDSLNLPYSATISESDPRQMHIAAPFADGKNYTLNLLPNAVEAQGNRTNDTLTFSMSAHKADHFGSVKLNFKNWPEDHAYILQVENDKGKVINEFAIRGTQIVSMNRMLPSTYTLRIISDRNNNGKWDSGNYWKLQQPETVEYFPEPIVVRSNWSQEFEWLFVR
jgi:hypothetical protein